MALLTVDGLNIHAEKDDGDVLILRNVSLSLDRGERKAVMGASGCGKTTLANAIMGFLKPDTYCDRGSITFDGIENVPRQISYEMIDSDPFAMIRGSRLAYVMQNVTEAFDPTEKIGRQIEELYEEDGFFERKKKAMQLLEKAQTADAKKTYRSFPQTVSPGNLQKILIMMALEKEPDVIILDEPFSALDAVSRQQMIEELQKHPDTGILLITHEAQAAKQLCTSCLFMAEGRISEELQTASLSDEEILRRMEP